jgi:hypothetical protein
MICGILGESYFPVLLSYFSFDEQVQVLLRSSSAGPLWLSDP